MGYYKRWYTNIWLYIKDPNNYKYITFIEFIGSRRDVLSNILILSGK